MFVRTEQPSYNQGESYESSYDRSSRRNEYGEEDYGRQQQSSYRGGNDEYQSSRGGYNEEGYGRNQPSDEYGETFGAERLNINDDEEERPHHGRRHRHDDD